MNTDDNLAVATVTWTAPSATDNSGDAPTVTSDYISGDMFPIGTTRVTYTATDPSGIMATVYFDVVVTGKTEIQYQKNTQTSFY